MLRKIARARGLVLSLPMTAMLLVTFVFSPSNISNVQNNVFLTIWLILFVFTLPWSIPITIAGFLAAFSPHEWWSTPLILICIASAAISAHVNGTVIYSALISSEN